MQDPNTIFGDDSRPDTRPIYCYAVIQLEIADVAPMFLTQHDSPVEIAGLPPHYGADDPQTFMAANIGHGPIKRESTFDKSAFELKALTRDIDGISRYAMTGAMPRIQVDVIKVNPGRILAGEPAEWAGDTLLVQTGLMASFTFKGYGVGIECVPEPLFSGHEVPRWRFSRTCNRQLYGVGCAVDPEPFTLASNIVGLNPARREVTIQEQHADPDPGFFRQGVLLHQPTGMRFSIFRSQLGDTTTILTLHQWNPDFALGDVVVARAGCRHTLEDCRDKFSNAANFGGFSEVPNKNPTLHGV